MSAPSSIGRCRYGEQKVLSTTTSAPCPCATSAHAARSVMVIMGFCVSTVGAFLTAGYVIKRLLGVEQAPIGFTTLVTLILFLGGIQLLAIGLLGEYLGRIYDEVKQRPLYIVKRRTGVGLPPQATAPPKQRSTPG